MITMRKMFTVAAAALAIGAGTLSMTTAADAGPKGGKHFKGHFHKWHGHRWHKRHFYGYADYGYRGCYWKFTPYGKIKVCPNVYY